MSYYQGDFHQGAPGFFSFIGGLAKSAAGFIPGVGPGISSALPKVGGAAKMLGAGTALAKRGASALGRGVAKHPVLTAAGGAGGLALGGMGVKKLRGAPKMAHLGLGRRRRMNVCNPRALRRSIRRTQGFAKLAMRTIHLVHPRKKARFGGFRKRRSKRVA